MSELGSAGKPPLDTLWYTRCAVPTPLGLAAQLGWFEEEFGAEGIALKSLQESADPVRREAHYDHSLNNAFRQGGSIPALWARASGRDTRLVGLCWTDEFQALIALPAAGIGDGRDLRGRRLGLPRYQANSDFSRAVALRGFYTALELAGLSDGDVELVDLPALEHEPLAGTSVFNRRPHGYASEAFALVRGEVDVIFVKGVQGLELLHLLGAQVVTDIGFHPDPRVRIGNGTPRTLTVDAGLLRERPDIAARFLARVVAAGEWAAVQQARALAAIGRETGAAVAAVRYAYGDDVTQRLHTDLAETSIAALEELKGFLFRHGFLPEDFSVRDWIEPQPLAAIRRHTSKKSA